MIDDRKRAPAYDPATDCECGHRRQAHPAVALDVACYCGASWQEHVAGVAKCPHYVPVRLFAGCAVIHPPCKCTFYRPRGPRPEEADPCGLCLHEAHDGRYCVTPGCGCFAPDLCPACGHLAHAANRGKVGSEAGRCLAGGVRAERACPCVWDRTTRADIEAAHIARSKARDRR